MAKQINVDLRVNADVNQAKRAMKELQDSLSKLTISDKIDIGKSLNGSVSEAKKDIALLKAQLQDAFNVDTGKIDFVKFNNSLMSSNKTLNDYASSLRSLGPEGSQAFLQLSRAISNSEIPVIRLNSKVKELGTALANTARWQISSSILHGFMGAIQSAYGYAQDLNRSLNDIRIVSGQSAEQMEKFAERANIAAKSLSATTNEYTKASLIFYQQGLNDDEVEARTNATIKMAHVAGESATEVSSYMTAIWNNFAEAGDNLEYYEDVIAKLGATTAASSAEIAGGLEKFAAVAKTVGLSYEYAAAAVTTIVDKTRQSEDVVGTSLKTIFARMEGLQQGKTEEDGTDLNKYSKALLNVGVNIKTASGELKNMDTILDEVGARWLTLADDEKIALAQTVGGMRQYNQFIALMDNYNDVLTNVDVARNSEGTINEKQEIYAESWEAAATRVRTAMEGIYNQILDDDFFITLLDNTEKVISSIGEVIDTFGGLKGVLLAISPILYNLFGDKILSSVKNFGSSVLMMMPGSKAYYEKERQDSISLSKNTIKQSYGEDSEQYKIYSKEIEYDEILKKYGNDLTEIDKQRLEIQKAAEIQEIKNIKAKEKELEILEETLKKEKKGSKDFIDSIEANGIRNNQIIKNSLYERVEGLKTSSSMSYILEGEDNVNSSKDGIDTLGLNVKTLGFYLQDNKKQLQSEATGFGQENYDSILKAQQDIEESYNALVKMSKSDNANQEEINKKKLEILKLYEQLKISIETSVQESKNGFSNLVEKSISKENFDEQKLANNKGYKDEINEFIKNNNLGEELSKKSSRFETIDKRAETLKKELEGKRDEIVKGRTKTELNDELNDEEKKQLKIYKEKLKQLSDIIDKRKNENENILKKEQEYEQTQQDIIDEMEAEVSGNTSKGDYARKKAEIELAKQEEEKKKQDLEKEMQEKQILAKKEAALGNVFSGTIQSITSLTSAYVQLSSVANAWNEVSEGNMTTGQALTQTFLSLTTVTTALASASQGLKLLAEGYKNLDLAIIKTTISKRLEAAAEENALIKTIMATQAKFAQTLAEKGFGAALKASTVELFAQAKAATVASGPLIVLTAAIVAAVMVYQKWKSINVELQKDIDERNKKIEEEKAATEELTKALQDNTSKFILAKNEWEKGNISKQQYKDTVLNVAEALGIENAQILAQAEAYELLNKEILEASKHKTAEVISNTLDIQSNIRSNGIEYLAMTGNGVYSDGSFATSDVTKEEKELLENLSGFSFTEEFGDGLYGMSMDIQQVDFLALADAVNEFKSKNEEASADMQALIKFVDNVIGDETYNGYKSALENSYSSLVQLDFARGYESQGSVSEVISNMNSRKETFTDTVANNTGIYLDEATKKKIYYDAIKDYGKNEAVASMFYEIEKRNSSLTAEALASKYDSLNSEEEKKQFISAIGNAKNLETLTLNGLDQSIEDFNHSVQALDIEGLKKSIDETISIFDKFKTGDIVIDEEDIKNILNLPNWQDYFSVLEGTDSNPTKLMTKYINDEAKKSMSDDLLQERIDAYYKAQDNLDYYSQKDISQASIVLGAYVDQVPEQHRQQVQNEYDNSVDYSSELEASKNAIEEFENMASDLTTEQLLKYNEVLEGTYETYKDIAALNTAKVWGLSAEEVQKYANELTDFDSDLADSKGEAEELAVQIMLLNDGVDDLVKNYDNWSETLKTADRGSKEYQDALDGMRTSMQKIFGSEIELSEEFILENMNNLQAYLNGDEQALAKIRQNLAEIQLAEFSAQDGYQDILNTINELTGLDIEVGATVQDQQFYTAINDMIAMTDWGRGQIQSFLDSIGFEAEFDKNGNVVKLRNKGAGNTSGYSSKAGKGGGGSSRSKKDQKDYQDEFERYYKITRQIKDQEDELTRLGKAKDRAFGATKLAYIDKESKALEKQIDLQKQYIDEITDYYKQDMSKLNAFGATYDENGVLTNYEQIVKAQVEAYNAAVDKYNAGGSEEEFDKASKTFDYFKEVLKQYDETNQLYQEQMDKMQDLKNEYYDKAVEKIETEIDLKINIDDRELALLEYRLKRIQDTAFNTAKSIAVIFSELDRNLNKQSTYQSGINNILSNHGVSLAQVNGMSGEQLAALGFTQKEIDDLKDYSDQLLSVQENIDDLEQQILNGPLNTVKEWNDEFERGQKAISHYGNTIKSFQNIAELSRSTTGVGDQFILDIQRQGLRASESAIVGYKAARDANVQALEELKLDYENAIANGEDENTIDTLRKNMREMEDIVYKSEEDLNKSIEDSLKQTQELLKATVEAAKKEFADLTSGTGSADFDDTIFDLATERDDFYLDDYEKIHQLSGLERKINSSMSETNNPQILERYNKLLEQINQAREDGVELTQYQVDAMVKEFELQQAMANLEDAQNSKHIVRMSRDAEGNMGYVYTADDNEDALQNYEDKLYEYQKLNSDYIKNQEKALRDLEKKARDAMAAVAMDTTLTPEQKAERIAELEKWYNEMAVSIGKELDLALGKNKELYDDYWKWYSDKYDYAISKEDDYQTAFHNTILGQIQKDFPDAKTLVEDFVEKMSGEEGYISKLTEAWTTYAEDQSRILEESGTNVESLGEAAQTAADKTTEAATEISDATKSMLDDLAKVEEYLDKLGGYDLSNFRTEITDTVGSINKMTEELSKVPSQMDEINRSIQEASQSMANITGVASGGSSSGGTGPSGGDINLDAIKKATLKASLSTLLTQYYNNRTNQSGAKAWSNIQKAFTDTYHSSDVSLNGMVDTIASSHGGKNMLKSLASPALFGDRAKTIFKILEQFDTGGYTGAWNSSDGRLAFLHEKELVLNKEDTANMLKIVEAVRSIMNNISIPSVGGVGEVGNISNGTFEQNVHIEANFPNATDRNEIEEAFRSLTNVASQYANRKFL